MADPLIPVRPYQGFFVEEEHVRRIDKGTVLTILSEAMAQKICQYCANSTGKYCMADVPWYCASIQCGYFAELPLPKKPVSDNALARRCLRALVETT
jgi:hypothetical protein